MDTNEEYQDPDYHESSGSNKKPVQEMSEEEQAEKIRNIIRREFGSEIEARENEVTTIDQRLVKARRILHRLRYALVNNFYSQERLQLSSAQLQDDLDTMAHVQGKPELSTVLREGQRRIHPSVRRLLGKGTVSLDEILKSREPRNKIRRDYHAMVKAKNVTTPADATTSLRPVTAGPVEPEAPVPPPEPEASKPKKVPRHIDPKITSIFTIDEATRNKMKHRYRIIIGNTSKYAPPASRADRSTHKWLLYIRGPPQQPDISKVVTAATIRLHHSYAPHHTVHLLQPPFHVSRRGWGEFPAKIELHFALPSRNRPATVEHTIKLDRNYTGLQTLGAETIVDVWLYSTPEMLKYEFSEDDRIVQEPDTTVTQTQPDTHTQTQNEQTQEVCQIKQEIIEVEETNVMGNHMGGWNDFFSKNTSEVNVDEMLVKTNVETESNPTESEVKQEMIPESQIETEQMDFDDTVISNDKKDNVDKKRIVKYIEPNTGKIYYLEMDRNLDLTKVQEIIIESEDGVKTAKISPMKPNGVKNIKPKKESLLKPEFRDLSKKYRNFNHIQNDHCYVMKNDREESVDGESDEEPYGECSLLQTIHEAVFRLSNVKMVVDYMLKKIPIISEEALKPNFLKYFPFVVDSEERYWKMDFAKRRNIEWSRAKLINKTLQDRFGGTENIWRTKQILIYSRLHGYNPIRTEVNRHSEQQTEEWSSWNDLENSRKTETNIKEIYPDPSDISTLTIFDSAKFLPYINQDLVDLTDCEEEIDVVSVNSEVKPVLPVAQDVSHLTVLPVEDSDDRLRFLYIERKCADIGIELRNEDVGNGCSYSAVHAVMLSAMKSYAEELIRSALAAKLTERRDLDYLPSVWVGSSSRSTVNVEYVYGGTRASRLHALSARALAAAPRDTTQRL